MQTPHFNEIALFRVQFVYMVVLGVKAIVLLGNMIQLGGAGTLTQGYLRPV